MSGKTSIAWLLLGTAISGAACHKATPPPEGAAAFGASRQKFHQRDQLTVEWSTTTELGVFTHVAELDCGRRYYHYKYVTDLSAKGIEFNTTTSQGRPRAHQEEEQLFIDGQSFRRFSGSWENAPTGYDWQSARNSYEPTEECQALSQVKDTAFIPFGAILSANKIVYQGEQVVSGVACHQYQATHSELGFSDSMTTRQLGAGSSVSYRESVMKPVQSVVCLGVDDLLPRRVVKGDLTVKYSYDPIQMIDAPSVSQD
jgi:hypothetical protein